MSNSKHGEMVNFIWGICNLLRGPYKRNEYRKVILPLTVLRRFDCILAPTKSKVLEEHSKIKTKGEVFINTTLCNITKVPFYNISKLEMVKLLDDSTNLPQNLMSYINGFSNSVRDIIERFKFDDEIKKMNEKNLLYMVVKKFAEIDLSYDAIDNVGMGYIFEELIRIGAEQSNEQAGEHFTPREVIKLMVNILLVPKDELNFNNKVIKIYDPACGTGGMLSLASEFIKSHNNTADIHLYGQDHNDEAWALCKADTLIKGSSADNIILGNSFTQDGLPDEKFDYMLANPPFGVSWEQGKKFITDEHEKKGFSGRFGAGTPRISDGSLLFLQHMISKMQEYKPKEKKTGSRLAIVFNGSPLFSGDAGSGESEIRRWIIESDFLEAIIALPDQLFYNTGISTYIWVLSNKKPNIRKGKVQLIDAREFYKKMRKSLGNKRKEIPDEDAKDYIKEITKIYNDFKDNAKANIINDNTNFNGVVSKIFDNNDFGYTKITVERPLKLKFNITEEGIVNLKNNTTFTNLSISKKKKPEEILKDEAEGMKRQTILISLLESFANQYNENIYLNRDMFINDIKQHFAKSDIKLSSVELKAIVDTFSERDEQADFCLNSKGEVEADSELRDTENIPLKEDIREYFNREVIPHVADAWIDESKNKVGYEIPFTRYFYVFKPLRNSEDILEEIKELETKIAKNLKEVIG